VLCWPTLAPYLALDLVNLDAREFAFFALAGLPNPRPDEIRGEAATPAAELSHLQRRGELRDYPTHLLINK